MSDSSWVVSCPDSVRWGGSDEVSSPCKLPQLSGLDAAEGPILPDRECLGVFQDGSR